MLPVVSTEDPEACSVLIFSGSRMEFDMASQLKGNRKETENKTIRFPIHLIDQIEQAISDSDQDITFSSFVIQACEYALDHMDAPSEEHN